MATNPVRRMRGPGPLTPEEVAREQAVRRQIYAEFPSLRMTRYRDIGKELVHKRWINLGCPFSEEAALLEQMHRLWSQLTQEERDVIDAKPPESLIGTAPAERRNGYAEVDVLGSPGKAPVVRVVA